MKGKKLYLVLIAGLSVMVVYLLEAVIQDRGITLGNVVIKDSDRPQEWQNIIASDVNSERFRLEVDGNEVRFDRGELYMGEDMNIMLPAYIFREVFQCAFNTYTDEKVILQKGNTIVAVERGKTSIDINGKKLPLAHGMEVLDGSVYINAAVLQKGFDYHYKWDAQSNVLQMADTHKSESILPASYNYRDAGRLPSTKNQGSFSTCWAFASLTAVESSLMPEENYIFSVDNMVHNNGYSMKQNEGGDYTRAIAYLTSWRGPVLESDDVYGDGICNTDALPVKHVQEVQIIESKNLEAIKRAVFLDGGVESSLYTSMNNVGEASVYYNENTNSYCYIGTRKPNHDIVIVGWDDHYSRDNFSENLEGDGAFICINSWGAEFGDDGLFYVSYYDSNIGIHNVVYTGVEETDNYDSIYQSDICGWVGQLGYEEEGAYFSNVYTADGAENIEAVGFYATGKNTSYEIYAVEDFEGEHSFDNKYYIQSGSFTNAGYYTVPLKTKVKMTEGKKYAIVVKIKTPDSVHPIAIEYRAGRATRDVILDDGEGYISLTGKSWEHVEESKECNICLKMYTKTNIEE